MAIAGANEVAACQCSHSQTHGARGREEEEAEAVVATDAFDGPHAGEDRQHPDCGEFMLTADGNRGQTNQCVAPGFVWRQSDAGEESERGRKRELVLYRSGEPVNAMLRRRHDGDEYRVEEGGGQRNTVVCGI